MPVSPNEITIDLGRDALLSAHALETLKDRYLVAGETSPQHAFARAAAGSMPFVIFSIIRFSNKGI